MVLAQGQVHLFVLRDGSYAETAGSEVLPGIDLAQLAIFLDRPTSSQAMREYRAVLQQR